MTNEPTTPEPQYEGDVTVPTYSYPPGSFHARPPQPLRGLGNASLVLGIIAVPFALIPFVGLFGFILGVLGTIFGAVAVNRVKKGTADNKGVAWWGLSLSILAVVASTVVFVATVVAIDDSADEMNDVLEEGGWDSWAECINDIPTDKMTDANIARCDELLEQ